jgi:hypothetical protein
VRAVLSKPLVVRDLVHRISALLGPEPLHLLPPGTSHDTHTHDIHAA